VELVTLKLGALREVNMGFLLIKLGQRRRECLGGCQLTFAWSIEKKHQIKEVKNGKSRAKSVIAFDGILFCAMKVRV
jgi:hypothetical protein